MRQIYECVSRDQAEEYTKTDYVKSVLPLFSPGHPRKFCKPVGGSLW